MFAVKVFLGKERAKIGAAIALTNRLFVSGWQLNARLKMLVGGRHKYDDAAVAIGYLNGVPITCVVDEQKTQAFCRKAHRRNRYASRTLKALIRKRGAITARAEEGIYGSVQFWKAQNVKVTRYRGILPCG